VQGTYTTEAIQDILNILDTLEHSNVAVHTAALNQAAQLGFDPLALSVVQASVAEEQYHVDFLESLGARTLTDTFTLRAANFTNRIAFFGGMVFVGVTYSAGYMTAAREFAELGQPTLVKYAYQIGVTKAEHGVLGRTLLALAGVSKAIPPNDKAFETDHWVYVRDLYKFLQDLGLFGKSEVTVTYPGRDAALAAAGPMANAVNQRAPNNASVSSTSANAGTITAGRGPTP
jgi:hypothetical protein